MARRTNVREVNFADVSTGITLRIKAHRHCNSNSRFFISQCETYVVLATREHINTGFGMTYIEHVSMYTKNMESHQSWLTRDGRYPANDQMHLRVDNVLALDEIDSQTIDLYLSNCCHPGEDFIVRFILQV